MIVSQSCKPVDRKVDASYDASQYFNCNSNRNVSVAEPENASLGTIAKFASQYDNPRDEATIKRFKLQSLAAEILPLKRVSNCLRLPVPGAMTVDILHDPQRLAAHYANLRTCDSVWDCPVCAAKITEQRREELMLAIAHAAEDGLTPVLVTWTLRHHKGDRLQDLLAALKDSHRALKSGRWFQSIKASYGWVGSVTSTENTYGDNGWHPHLHELVFLEPIAAHRLNDLRDALRERWSHVLAKCGYDATWAHGVDLRDSDSAIYEYVAKWGHEPKGTRWTVERELTKAPTKQASKDGLTPLQILEAYGAAAGDKKAHFKALYREYSECFHGRAQLVWSRGLRDRLGLGKEKSDEDLNELPGELIIMAQLTRWQWRQLMLQPQDVRGQLLVVARAGDRQRLADLLADLLGDHFQRPATSHQSTDKDYQSPVTKLSGGNESSNFEDLPPHLENFVTVLSNAIYRVLNDANFRTKSPPNPLSAGEFIPLYPAGGVGGILQ